MNRSTLADRAASGSDPPRPFFIRVQSLRGLGALAVAGYHVSGWMINGVSFFPYAAWETVGPVQNALGRAALALFPGHAALMMFFVISGYVLRLSLQFGPQSIGAASWTFLVSRIFRIYPMVIFGTIVFLLVARWSPLPRSSPPLDLLGSGRIAANFLLLDTSVNSNLWALQVEMLMAPFLLLFYFLERRFGEWLLATIALITLVLSFHGGWAIWAPFSHNFFAFVLGILIPTFGRQFVAEMSRPAAQRWLLVALAALLLPGQFLGFYSRFTAVFEALGAFLLISLVSLRNDLPGLRALDHPGLRTLGLISGSFYVLHMATLPWAMQIFEATVPVSWSINVPALVGLLVVSTWLLAITPLMWVSYHAIEAPGIALGRWVARLRGKRPPGRNVPLPNLVP